MTLANWGCGIDPILNTISIPKGLKSQQNQIIKDEEEYRRLMTIYAWNDCLAVTQSVRQIGSTISSVTSTMPYEDISDDEQTIIYQPSRQTVNLSSFNDVNDELEIHVQHDILNDDNHSIGKSLRNELTGVRDQNEPYEMISDDNSDDMSLPEIMKLHLPFISPYLNRYQFNNKESRTKNDNNGVHALDEPPNNVEIIFNDEPNKETMTKQCHDHQSLTRNQRKNRIKRAQRYRYEVIRQIYYRFTIRNIKKVLLFMNIAYVNINVVGTTLFIGVKNEQIRRTVDAMLHNDIFTEEHYYRIRKRLHMDTK